MVSREGVHFKGLYDSLVAQSSSFPDDDPSPSLRECVRADYVNFVRAEVLARRHNLPSNILHSLQELALMQYAWDFRNLPGLERLVKEYSVTLSERRQMVLNIVREGAYPCFSFGKNTEQSIDESWVAMYALGRSPRTGYMPREGVVSRFIAWLRSLFVRSEAGGRE